MMEKVKKLLKNPKVAIGTLVGAIVILLLVVIFVINPFGFGMENKLNKYLEEIGKDFYTEFFYPQLETSKSKEELQTFLKDYETIGIKSSLDNLSRSVSNESEEKIKEFNTNKVDCDKDATRVIIYPVSPYGKNDFRIEIELNCNFDKK